MMAVGFGEMLLDWYFYWFNGGPISHTLGLRREGG